VKVAITERGDAALTADTLGSLRFWPSLDGKHPSVPVGSLAPAQLALAHNGSGLLAAMLDDAGGVQLLRLERDGTIRGRVQLPGDVRCEQVVAVGDNMLLRREDQSIERYDADGRLRGRLVAEPQGRIATIAVRRDSAIALLDPDEKGATDKLRWIVLGDELRWGTRVVLPERVRARSLALSPDHRRIAGIEPSTSKITVLGLDPPEVIDGMNVGAGVGDADLGFVDDNRVAGANGGNLSWWSATPPPPASSDPWEVPPRPGLFPSSISGEAAIGDGVVIAGYGASLLVADASHVRYLAWQQFPTTPLVAGELMAMWNGNQMIWLDDKLERTRVFDIREQLGRQNVWAIPVGSHHVVLLDTSNYSSPQGIELVDADRPAAKVMFGKHSAQRMEFDPVLGVLTFVEDSQLLRFQLDLVHMTATALPPLQIRRPHQTYSSAGIVRLMDPARGTIAMATIDDDGGTHLMEFQAAPGGAVKRKIRRSWDAVLAIDSSGAIWGRSENAIVAARDGKVVARIADGQTVTVVSPSHDAKRVALWRENDIVMIDHNGVEQWHRTLWGTGSVTFTLDDRRVVVLVAAGLVELDAATGATLGAECGWGFGLYDQAPPSDGRAISPVCEELGP
jgi:hypothetical protein